MCDESSIAQWPEPPAAGLAVVLVTPDRWDTIRQTAGLVQAQTVRSGIELVIVAPSAEVIDLRAPELAGFHSIRVVAAGPIRSVAQANARGALAATAPVVAFIEDHAFPDPDWAAALIRAHEGPWAAVSPVARNAAPDSVVAWADHLVSYGPWMDPSPSGPRDSLCWHNVSYKRELLFALGDELEAQLSAETNLHNRLTAEGRQLYLAGDARIAHLGFVSFRGAMDESLYNGITFASGRVVGWPSWRRALYTVGAPLIPSLRLARLVRQLRANPGQRNGVPIAAWSVVVLILFAGALGELLGYSGRAGDIDAKAARYEFRRRRASRVVAGEGGSAAGGQA